MTVQVDQQTIWQVARLANIELTAGDALTVHSELSQILDYVQLLDRLDLSGVEPFFGIVEHANRTRADQVAPGLSRAQVLENAPDQDGEYFRVPPVFG